MVTDSCFMTSKRKYRNFKMIYDVALQVILRRTLRGWHCLKKFCPASSIQFVLMTSTTNRNTCQPLSTAQQLYLLRHALASAINADPDCKRLMYRQ